MCKGLNLLKKYARGSEKKKLKRKTNRLGFDRKTLPHYRRNHQLNCKALKSLLV